MHGAQQGWCVPVLTDAKPQSLSLLKACAHAATSLADADNGVDPIARLETVATVRRGTIPQNSVKGSAQATSQFKLQEALRKREPAGEVRTKRTTIPLVARRSDGHSREIGERGRVTT